MDYITTVQMADLMGISRIAVFNQVKNGDIKAERFGRAYFIEKQYAFDYAEKYKKFKDLSRKQKEDIENAVKKVKEQYSETLNLLSNC